MNLKENRVTKVKNNLGFKEWMQQESGTTSSSIATFAMPLGAIVRRKFPNEKKKKNKKTNGRFTFCNTCYGTQIKRIRIR